MARKVLSQSSIRIVVVAGVAMALWPVFRRRVASLAGRGAFLRERGRRKPQHR